MEFVENISVSERERNLEFGFWDVLRQEYVDIQGKKIREKPKLYSLKFTRSIQNLA